MRRHPPAALVQAQDVTDSPDPSDTYAPDEIPAVAEIEAAATE